MLTTCPNCLHVFDQHVSSVCCASSRPPDSWVAAGAAPAVAPVLLSATLQLPPSAPTPGACTLALTATAAPLRALTAMAGGGIVHAEETNKAVAAATAEASGMWLGTEPAPPQPSPSAPLSFVLPAPGTPRALPACAVPFPWSAGSALQLSVQLPTQGLPQSPAQSSSPGPQSDTDLERLAATMSALRVSGWYYEGLSWQESADVLQTTAPGTFLVRDSSDPRFLFSLSVQTERGPTSIRLHYVCGNFRLDAEPRLAPLMPLFACVVKLVEHYVELTRRRGCNQVPPRDKEQVWVDARGQMYSHILLRRPLYKKQQLPNLQHLSRLVINRQTRAAGRAPSAAAAAQLPLPSPLRAFVSEYPYMH